MIENVALGQLSLFAAGLVVGFALQLARPELWRRSSARCADGAVADDTTGNLALPRVASLDESKLSPEIVQQREARKQLVALPPLRRDEPRWLPAREHAAALLRWLQEAGRTGEVTAREIAVIYPEMCMDKYWAVRPWNTVATEFRKLTGGGKDYAWRGGERIRVYRIPQFSTAIVAAPKFERRAAA